MSDEANIPPRGTFDETMGEISGFGGAYEDACRQMLKDGLEYLDANPDCHPRFQGFEGVYGLLMDDNDDAKALTKAMMKTVTDPSGAMHQAVCMALLGIRKHGWPFYVGKMRK